jgi:two-component system CheB/CheR fusion protein
MGSGASHRHEPTAEFSEASDDERRGASAFPIVGVGASAGGLEAFTQLLEELPSDTGAALVLIQHLDPKHESRLDDLLSRVTKMPVAEAADGIAVLPNNVYVIPPNTNMAIAGGVLRITPREERGPHLPLDFFFRSLAEDQRASGIAVVLSGTGSDGTLGLAEVKAAGGITFAQSRESAKFDGMPQSAIASGAVDFILPPKEIARKLANVGRHPYLLSSVIAPQDPVDAGQEEAFRTIIAMLQSAFGVDFAQYRETTIRRRTMRRMALHSQESLADYARLLERDRSELEALYHDILINVTSFFRDAEMFEVLKSNVFPELVKTKGPGTPIRIWTAGCSTGQEAYSLAIALLEYLDDKAVRPPIQIFATDLSDTMSLETARAGLYPESIEAEVSPERLRRFFTKESGHYRVSKAIRDLCVFAKQNIVSDPPFSRMDLISCRNVLIYLAASLQKRVIPTFHYALNPTGLLMLGASETIGAFSDLFAVVDKAHRIYSKRASAFRQYPHFVAKGHPAALAEEAGSGFQPSLSAADLQREADRIVLAQYAPAGVLVSPTLEILQFRGRTSAYLEPAPGVATLNVLKMAREGLYVELNSALEEAKTQGTITQRLGVRIRDDGHFRALNIKVVPVKMTGMSESCFLVLFEAAGASQGQSAAETSRTGAPRFGGRTRTSSWLKGWLAAPRAGRTPAANDSSPDRRDREIAQLSRELVAAREQHQATIEQHDAATEELKSASEEILSSNEELQSTNEELETAKEELQSVNEELTTVNEQLQARNLELNHLTNDLINLLSSANIPVVMLGSDLRIRRFTPAAGKILNLLPSDVSRPIGDLRPADDVPDLESLLEEVIETVQVLERDVRGRNGRWYQLRLHPYRTTDNKIDGAVIVLVDIDLAKTAQLREKESADYTRAIVETMREPLLILGGDLRVKTANQSFYQTFEVTPEQTENQLLYELGAGAWDIPQLRALLNRIIPGGPAVEDFQVEHDFSGLGQRVMLLNARRLLQQDGRAELILLAISDVTERTRADRLLRQSEERLHAIVTQVTAGIAQTDFTGRFVLVNQRFCDIVGYSQDELYEMRMQDITHPADLSSNLPLFQKLAEGGPDFVIEKRYVRKDGSDVWVNNSVSVLCDPSGKQQSLVAVVIDISMQKRAAEALKAADVRKNEFLAMLAHELRNPLSAISNAVQLIKMSPDDSAASVWSNELIERQVKNLVRLVDDLLDIARITQGKILLRKETLELGPLLNRAVAMVRHHIDDRRHALSIMLPEVPVRLVADPTRLEQIVVNLLNNAAKYTEPGGRLGLEVSRDGTEAVIAVRDTGVGISPQMLPFVFDLFTQVDRSIDRSQGGLGIGLTLVRSLVEMHDGAVSASSTLGEGSIFTVRLPLGAEQPEHLAAPARAAAETRSRRILIVEDNADVAQGMAGVLKRLGHDVRTANDGPSAIETARAARPEIILLDVGLPGMDGYEVASELRRQQAHEDAVIVAISGYGESAGRNRSKETAFDHYLVKPVNYDELLRLFTP